MRLPALVAGLVVAAAVMVAQLAQPALAGSWLQQGVALPPGATSVLNGVACTSPDACMAVGSFHDSGGTHLLAESRSGSTWMTVTIPDPGDAQLNAISCTSATACAAVGSSGCRASLVRDCAVGTPGGEPEPDAAGWWAAPAVPDSMATCRARAQGGTGCRSPTI